MKKNIFSLFILAGKFKFKNSFRGVKQNNELEENIIKRPPSF